MSVTADLARLVVASEPDAGAIAAARLALVDFLACAVAGAKGADSARASDGLLAWAGAGDAVLIGKGRRVDPASAALLNGYYGHALDYDDVHASMRGHPGTVIFPALLAAHRDESAERFLAAFVVGVEVAGRVGLAIGTKHYERGFHATSTVGAIAAAAAVAWLRGLDAAAMESAIGMGATQASGMRVQFGTEVKPLHAGIAARAGVQAVALVEAGLSGAGGVLDGPNGFFAMFGYDAAKPERAVEGWGAPWQIVAPGLIFKEFACCTATHCAAQAILGLLAERPIAAEDVAGVTVTFPHGGDAALVTTQAETGVDGRFSVEYMIARAITDGALGVATFDETPVAPAVAALSAKVVRAYDDTAPRMTNDPKTRFSVVDVALRDGTVLSRRENKVNGLADPSAKFLDATGGAAALLDALRTMKTTGELHAALDLLTETTHG